jgi:dipeptidyl aminopeptidase/acylaminoacyl peptidase
VLKILSFAAALALAGLSHGFAQTPLLPIDVFSLESAADPQISPDGRQIAYVRRSNNIETDQTEQSVWMIGTDDQTHQSISHSDTGASSPRWSTDGQRLAYVASKDGEAIIRIHTPETGEDVELITVASGASALSWSPDDTRLAFASFLATPGETAAPLPARPESAEWAAPAQVESRLRFRLDGVGALPPGAQHLFVVDARTGDVEQVTSGNPAASGDFSWSPDGTTLVFSADRRVNAETSAPDSELYRLDLASGEISQLTHRLGPDTTPRISPNGEWLAYVGYDDRRMGYHNAELYLAASDGSAPRSLTADLDRSVSAPVWSADGNSLYVQFDDQGATRVARVSLDGETEIVASGLGGAGFGRPYTGGSYSVSRSGQIAATLAPSTHPAEVAIFESMSDRRVLTDLNSDILGDRTLSAAEEIRWTSPHDGREIQGWALYPPDFDADQTWPLILEIHGGPFSAYGPTFSAELQLMAAAGYVVVYTNPRGSTSYGYEFANLIHHDYPGNDYDDLMGAVDHMLARGFIDPDRLFVTGGSGGGVLTAWIVGNTDRFAAAVVAKPVINWTSFVLYSDLPQFFYRYWFANAPWDDPEEYWRRSPLSIVGNVNTPTMLMVGGADVRTPRAETEQYYSALRLRGVPTRLVIVPDAFHGIAGSRPSRLLTKVAEILRWFEEHDTAAPETNQ